jgi:hypothetical protein
MEFPYKAADALRQAYAVVEYDEKLVNRDEN